MAALAPHCRIARIQVYRFNPYSVSSYPHELSYL